MTTPSVVVVFHASKEQTAKIAEHTATAHALLQELLDRTGLDPDIVGLFAGALVYTQYGWLKRHVMRAIVKREGGDLDMTRDFEYTDWAAVERFADDVATLVASTTDS